MSRSDEEGFHPHPGDPWHPGWEGDDAEPDPFAPEEREPDADAPDSPKRRRRFGRRKDRGASADSDADQSAGEDADEFPEASGWEAYDDEMVAAELESVPSEGAPSWTDEGTPSVEFESAFTVGGEVVPEDPATDEMVAADDLPSLADPEVDASEEPTRLLDEVVLPDLPDLTGLDPAAAEADQPGDPGSAGAPQPSWTDSDEDPTGVLDSLLGIDEEPAADDGAVAADDGAVAADEDLARLAEEAAAALAADETAAAAAADEALEVVADEFDAVEVIDEPPTPPGLQESLLEPATAPAPDPGFTPEPEEDLFGELPGPEEAPPEEIAAVLPDPDAVDLDERPRVEIDPEEIAPADDVDAALLAIAAEPVAAADADAIDALRAIDEDDDDDVWHAFAEGEPVPIEEAAAPAYDDSGPSAAGGEAPAGDLVVDGPEPVEGWGEHEELPEEPAEKRGFFGRRKRRPTKEEAVPADEAAFDEAVADDGWASDEPESVAQEAGDGEAEPLPTGEVPAGGWVAEGDAWDDEIAGDEEADAFFTAPEEPKRGWLGGRRRKAAAVEPEVPAAAVEGLDEAAEDDGWMSEKPELRAGPSEPPSFAPEPEVSGDEFAVESAEPLDEPLEPVGESFEPVRESLEPLGESVEPVAESIEPLGDLPLLDEDDRRIEVTPVSGVDTGPAFGAGAETESDPDEPEEDGEWQGGGAAVPRSWFADLDEDEVEVEDLQPVDAEEAAPVLEAGAMFDVDDILDPLQDEHGDEDPAGAAPSDGTIAEPPPPLAAVDDPVEPTDLFPAPAADAGFAADDADPVGRTAASLFPEDPTGESEVTGAVAEPPPLPGAGAEAWDAPPLVPATEPEWEDPIPSAEVTDGDPSQEDPVPPPIDPTAEVYDVVEDDLDRAPDPEPVIDPDAPVEWNEGIYSGAVTVEHRGLAEAVARASTEDTELQALSAAMPGLETGVVGFEDVEDLGTDEVYIPPVRSDLGPRILTGLLLISLLLASLWAGGAALAAFIGLMLMIGLTEFYATLRHKGYSPLALFGYLGAIGVLAGTWVWGPIAIPASLLAATVVVFFFYAFAPRRRDVLVNGGLTVMGVAWLTGTVAFAMPIIASENYRVLVFALVAATVAMDVGAYGFGRAWGSAQMAPILSPNKSIEGLAGGVLLSIGVAIAIGYMMDPFDIRSGAALGLVVAVTAPLGDLAESMFKRSLGVKDMGSILPGHGGIMDRVDAFLFVIPPVWVLYEFLGYLS